MVFYYTSTVVDPPAHIYVGKDKYENEDLITYGWPEDVWFHVDKLSSAHVYVRLQEGQTWEDMSPALIEDCAALVKANSIVGCKQSSVSVVYTPWENLKKTHDMAVGQVSFHSNKMVKHVVSEKKNDVVNRLNKTKREDYPDLAAERQARDRRLVEKTKKINKERMAREKEEHTQMLKEAKERSYEGMFDEDKMTSNQFDHDVDVNAYEEDFM